MNKCPKCKDGKVQYINWKVLALMDMDCHICEGTGEVSDEKLNWIKRGQELRDFRRATIKKGPTEVAKLLGICPSHLLKMESGQEKPEECYFDRIGRLVQR